MSTSKYPEGLEDHITDELLAEGWDMNEPGFESALHRRCRRHIDEQKQMRAEAQHGRRENV